MCKDVCRLPLSGRCRLVARSPGQRSAFVPSVLFPGETAGGSVSTWFVSSPLLESIFLTLSKQKKVIDRFCHAACFFCCRVVFPTHLKQITAKITIQLTRFTLPRWLSLIKFVCVLSRSSSSSSFSDENHVVESIFRTCSECFILWIITAWQMLSSCWRITLLWLNIHSILFCFLLF